MKGKAVPTTTALDREALTGSWPSSHPIQRSRLFFATTALDPEILARERPSSPFTKGKLLDHDGLRSGNFGQIKPRYGPT